MCVNPGAWHVSNRIVIAEVTVVKLGENFIVALVVVVLHLLVDLAFLDFILAGFYLFALSELTSPLSSRSNNSNLGCLLLLLDIALANLIRIEVNALLLNFEEPLDVSTVRAESGAHEGTSQVLMKALLVKLI